MHEAEKCCVCDCVLENPHQKFNWFIFFNQNNFVFSGALEPAGAPSSARQQPADPENMQHYPYLQEMKERLLLAPADSPTPPDPGNMDKEHDQVMDTVIKVRCLPLDSPRQYAVSRPTPLLLLLLMLLLWSLHPHPKYIFIFFLHVNVTKLCNIYVDCALYIYTVHFTSK